MADSAVAVAGDWPRAADAGLLPRKTLLRGLLILLLVVDLALIAAHVSRGLWQEPTSRLFDLTVETGYGEMFQAIKGAWSVVVLLLLVWWRRSFGCTWGGRRRACSWSPTTR